MNRSKLLTELSALFLASRLGIQRWTRREHDRAEPRVQNIEDHYRKVFSEINTGFCIVAMKFAADQQPIDYQFVEVNPAFDKQTGLIDAVGKWMRTLAPDHEQHWFDIYGHVARTGESVQFENHAQALGRWYDVHAVRIGLPEAQNVAILFNDITQRYYANIAIREANESLERRVAQRTAELTDAVAALQAAADKRDQAEAALRQAQKMEAVGQLTGGIAHDFNNMLQAIGASLELSQRRVRQDRGTDADRHIVTARETVARAAALTNQLLTFARRQTLQPRVVVPNELIRSTAELLRRAVGPAVHLALDTDTWVWPVLCDPNQLVNVLLNLAINARDAMPSGGRLIIQTVNRQLLATDILAQEAASAGDYVEIAVIDTGAGMSEATKVRAFEPFFTTKPFGQGTGLGLSQVFGFLQQSGGMVRLDSTIGNGTAVRAFLPRHRGDVDVVAPDEAQPGEPAAGAAHGTVLLVEDEEPVRETLTEQLRELGYQVLVAEEGRTALRIVLACEKLNLLITDVGLPGDMNGRQVADAVRELRHALPTLFITGYAGSAFDMPLADGMDVLLKPFSFSELATKVQTAIQGRLVA